MNRQAKIESFLLRYDFRQIFFHKLLIYILINISTISCDYLYNSYQDSSSHLDLIHFLKIQTQREVNNSFSSKKLSHLNFFLIFILKIEILYNLITLVIKFLLFRQHIPLINVYGMIFKLFSNNFPGQIQCIFRIFCIIENINVEFNVQIVLSVQHSSYLIFRY
jgi:hypothetical protein